MSTPATIAVAPSEEEDIARSRPWDYDDQDDDDRRRSKGKERDTSHGFIDSDGKGFIESPGHSSYPPANDSQAEARRVEETLKKWEAAELQRRKAARQSTASTSGSSLVDNVSRRASMLLGGRGRKSGSISNTASLGVHAPLPTQDTSDAVPLTAIPASPTPSPSRSDTDISRLDDPFNPPSESRSPFEDPLPSPNPADDQTSALVPQTPAQSNSFIVRQPPPALPLDLPPPKAPPPWIDSPDSSPKPQNDTLEDTRPTRWWHEWLCGCGEGPDRGGDHQAGKTNPLE